MLLVIWILFVTSGHNLQSPRDITKDFIICRHKFRRFELYKGGPKVISCNETRYPAILLSYQVELVKPKKKFPMQNDVFSVVVGQGKFCEDPQLGDYDTIAERSRENAPPMASCYNFDEGNPISGMRCQRHQVVQYLNVGEMPCIAVYCSNIKKQACDLWIQGYWEIATIVYESSSSIPIGTNQVLILGENFPHATPEIVCYTKLQQMPCFISELKSMKAVLKFNRTISEVFAGPIFVNLNLGTHWSADWHCAPGG